MFDGGSIVRMRRVLLVRNFFIIKCLGLGYDIFLILVWKVNSIGIIGDIIGEICVYIKFWWSFFCISFIVYCKVIFYDFVYGIGNCEVIIICLNIY